MVDAVTLELPSTMPGMPTKFMIAAEPATEPGKVQLYITWARLFAARLQARRALPPRCAADCRRREATRCAQSSGGVGRLPASAGIPPDI